MMGNGACVVKLDVRFYQAQVAGRSYLNTICDTIANNCQYVSQEKSAAFQLPISHEHLYKAVSHLVESPWMIIHFELEGILQNSRPQNAIKVWTLSENPSSRRLVSNSDEDH
jgi:hypothetical protein